MADEIPIRGEAFEFDVVLQSRATPEEHQVNPTLAVGDVKVIKDNGAAADIDTLPAVAPAGGKVVRVQLSADETECDKVTVVLSDAAGAEWCDLTWTAPTRSVSLEDVSASVAALAVVAAAIAANVTTLLARIPSALFAGITSLAHWLGALAGKHTPDATAQAEINATGGGSGSYDATTDSQQAIVDTAASQDVLANAVPGSYPSGSAGEALGRITTIYTKVLLLGSVTVTIRSAVATNGDLFLEPGDDYQAGDLVWTLTGFNDFTGSTVSFTCGDLAVAGSVVAANQLTVPLTSAQTLALLEAGAPPYKLRVQYPSSGPLKTVSRGSVNILA